MDGRAEMEVIRSTKGSAAGEVSVHLVANENTVQNAHLPATAFIIPGRGLRHRTVQLSFKCLFLLLFFMHMPK